jgi:CheY-like chemotaxis protein
MSNVNPQRILIADDNPTFRETLAQCLRARGHDVIVAETGERAFLALCNRSRPID